LRYFYVICPVGTDPAFPVKKAVLQELGSERGIEPFFPLEKDPLFSIQALAHDVRHAEFVLADLSWERPSCYFELGVVKALGAQVHLIADSGTPIHQVGGNDKPAFYKDLGEYRAAILKILSSHVVAERIITRH
jgi:hypothetical protein